MLQPPLTQDVAARAREIFADHRQRNFCWTDRLFALLLAFQYLAGIACALFVSPYTWFGARFSVHVHVFAALVVGLLISGPPVALALLRPGARLTRWVVAAAQASWSALLIHLSGGRIETHFHVFGSLAFLAFYRDWTVFIPATLLVAVDHGVRGWLWPMSVYGVALASPFRFLEHAGWVLFEDVFLVWSCLRNVRETRQIALSRAQLEFTNARVEQKVQQRTAELAAQAEALRGEIEQRVAAQAERERLNRELLDVSRRAGMAEVAESVLHNVGNVLNSVNASTSLIAERLKSSRISSVARLSALVGEHAHDLPAFLRDDERGRQVPGYLATLAEALCEEHRGIAVEVESLATHIEHIKHVVSTQQQYAGRSATLEPVDLAAAIRDALRMSTGSRGSDGIDIRCDLADVAPLTVDRHKLLQVLINLFRNARRAVRDHNGPQRSITIRLRPDGDGARIDVIDTGVGIVPENLVRVFAHGFTTHEDGRGIGLHSSAVTAQEMGGSLTAHSDGPGAGATFTLLVPGRRREAMA